MSRLEIFSQRVSDFGRRIARGRGTSRRVGMYREVSGAYLVALIREPDPDGRREQPHGLEGTCAEWAGRGGSVSSRGSSAVLPSGARFAMREMRATRGVGSGARTDVGRPALAGVLVEECDGWRGGIHGGVCLTRALGVAESDPLGHARRALFSRMTKNRVSLRLLGTAFMGPAATRRATTNDDNDEYVYRTDRHFRLHPRDASGRGAENDGYGSIGRGRYPTRAPAAWTHIPAGKKRSSLNSIGTSNNATGGASGGRTHAPKTPAAYLSRRRKRSTAAKSVDPPGTGNSRKKTAQEQTAQAERRGGGGGRIAIGSVGFFASPSTSRANP